VLVLAPVIKIQNRPEQAHDDQGIDRIPSPILLWRRDPKSFISPLSSLLRHGVFISRAETGLSAESFVYTATRRADGKTSIV
jgi:hypothetical protein